MRHWFNSGKNSKPAYYILSYLKLMMPRWVLRRWLRRVLSTSASRSDYGYIARRVDYYCRLKDASPAEKAQWMQSFTAIGSQRIKSPKVYYLDSLTYARCFPKSMKWNLCAGDVNFVPAEPSIVKSRPIGSDNANGVIMKLDKVRHFVFIHDSYTWESKLDKVIFRGAIGQKDGSDYKENRYIFIQKYFSHPMCDLGEIAENGCVNALWVRPKISIYDHLRYKFIMSLEGNDVASNLKWVMSSNSIAVMPKPKFETWFMEATLIPDYHYIEIKEDYSDLESKLNFYINHPDEANAIIRHAHEYVAQFRDSRREDVISLLVLNKYFKLTNPQ